MLVSSRKYGIVKKKKKGRVFKISLEIAFQIFLILYEKWDHAAYAVFRYP